MYGLSGEAFLLPEAIVKMCQLPMAIVRQSSAVARIGRKTIALVAAPASTFGLPVATVALADETYCFQNAI